MKFLGRCAYTYMLWACVWSPWWLIYCIGLQYMTVNLNSFAAWQLMPHCTQYNIVSFLPRECEWIHKVLLSSAVYLSVCLSVRPSVKRVNVTRRKKVLPTFVYRANERPIHLVFRHKEGLVGDVPFYLTFWVKLTHPLQKRRFSSIFARSASAL